MGQYMASSNASIFDTREAKAEVLSVRPDSVATMPTATVPATHQPAPTLQLAEASYGQEEKARGAVFTRQAVVDFMLDLIGYTVDKPLWKQRLLEPSFGGGRFVFSAVNRLIASWRTSNTASDPIVLLDSIRAVELDSYTYELQVARLTDLLVDHGISVEVAERLVAAWLIHDDFLFSDLGGSFDYVIGNPPYVRQELVDPHLLAQYRVNFRTMVGRADLYVAFIERALRELKPGGRFSYICADAWTKNDYGRALRMMVTSELHLEYYVDMYGVDAFEVAVGAYPSITVIARNQAGPTRATLATEAGQEYLETLRDILQGRATKPEQGVVVEVPTLRESEQPWLLATLATLPIIRRLEAKHPALVEAGCRVGIGVASGADKVFVGPLEKLDVEDDRKLPLATNRDVPNGQLVWSGKGVVNPYNDDGSLVDLALYPRLAQYLEPHRGTLSKRHTAKAAGAGRWYKTIDRITPSLTWEPKLLIPDIKGDGDAIAYDPGTLYPHHNLYYITSGTWNLRALQALLRSGVAHAFVEAYSVKIGGGFLRFQAQNLRRIRVPEWSSITPADQAEMIEAGETGAKIPASLIARVYGISNEEAAVLSKESPA